MIARSIMESNDVSPVIIRIHQLPLVLQKYISYYYGGKKYPKRDYIEYNWEDISNIKLLSVKINRGQYCKQCGGHQRYRYHKTYQDGYLDYIGCNCLVNNSILLQYHLHNDIAENILIPWIMEPLEANRITEANNRLGIAKQIIRDYRIIIKTDNNG